MDKWMGLTSHEFLKRMRSFCMLLLVCLLSQNAFAFQAKGWHWYNESIAIKKHQTIPVKNTTQNPKAFSATARMKAFQKEVQESLDQAVLDPTPQNIRRYLLLQQLIMNRSKRFTQNWQKTLLLYPDLDFSIKHPTENMAQPILSAKRAARETQAIRYYAKRYGLLFFYRGQNSLDQALGPIVSDFAARYHIAVIPVTMDKTPLASFPKTRLDEGQSRALHLTYFPALILVSPQTHQVTPLHYGFITEDELKARFLELVSYKFIQKGEILL